MWIAPTGRCIVLIALMLALGACSQVQSLEYGEPNFNTGILLPSLSLSNGTVVSTGARDAAALHLQPPVVLSDSLKLDCPDTAAFSQNQVKTCVYALKRIIDDQYREYRITLHHLADGGNAALDVANIGLTTAATATPGAAAKTVLSAIATGLLGTKTVLNEDLLYKQTIALVLNQMDADRDRQFAVMLKEMNDGNYTIGQAKDDLLLYFEYGTFDHAISSLQAAAAANKANCEAQRDNAKAQMAATPPATTTGCPPQPAAQP
jgi:hypothetical protein